MEDVNKISTDKVIKVLLLSSMDAFQKLNSCEEMCKSRHESLLKKLNKERESSELLANEVNKLPLEKMKKSCIKNAKYNTKLEKEIEDLKQKQKDLEDVVASEEEKVNIRKIRLSHLQEKKEKLEKQRDQILTYKLLTNTTFLYNSKNVKGYVVGDDPESMKSFDMNPKTLSKEQITEKLYSLINDVSTKNN